MRIIYLANGEKVDIEGMLFINLETYFKDLPLYNTRRIDFNPNKFEVVKYTPNGIKSLKIAGIICNEDPDKPASCNRPMGVYVNPDDMQEVLKKLGEFKNNILKEMEK